MIWFSCKQCSKKHNRPDSQGGAMIFCDCGQGLRVPWSSTIAEPENADEAIPIPRDSPPPAPRPSARAVPVDNEDGPRRRSIPVPSNPPGGAVPRRQRPYRKVNAAFCLNHDETASANSCTDCRLPFCADCLATVKGEPVCGPCKNFRLRAFTRAPRIAGLAIVSLVVALVSGPVAFCVGTFSVGAYMAGPNSSILLTLVMGIVGVLLPGAAIVLGVIALRAIDSQPNMGGRGMALTGFYTGMVGVLWNVMVAILVIVKQGGS